MGIPTVKRPAQSYLLSTLSDLLQKLTPAEKNDTLIILLIAEVSSFYCNLNNVVVKWIFHLYLMNKSENYIICLHCFSNDFVIEEEFYINCFLLVVQAP